MRNVLRVAGVLRGRFQILLRLFLRHSIAAVLGSLAPPDRETKRQYVLLIMWFRFH
jgi:hypothetical protein